MLHELRRASILTRVGLFDAENFPAGAQSGPAEPWTFVHFAALGGALTMLGPGGYSLDARLFGRKHIEIPER